MTSIHSICYLFSSCITADKPFELMRVWIDIWTPIDVKSLESYAQMRVWPLKFENHNFVPSRFFCKAVIFKGTKVQILNFTVSTAKIKIDTFFTNTLSAVLWSNKSCFWFSSSKSILQLLQSFKLKLIPFINFLAVHFYVTLLMPYWQIFN